MKLEIRVKIGMAIAFIALVISSLVGLVSMWSSKKIISLEAESKLARTVESFGIDFESDLQEIYHISYSLESLLKGTIPDLLVSSRIDLNAYKSKTLPAVENLLSTYKPLSAWIVFNPELAMGKHTISFEDIDGDGKYQREAEYSVNDFEEYSPSIRWW